MKPPTILGRRGPRERKLSSRTLSLKERVEQLNGMSEGDPISVMFDLRGREYNGNYYVDSNAWRIESDGQEAAQGASSEQATAPQVDSAPLPDVEPMVVEPASEDDLPF